MFSSVDHKMAYRQCTDIVSKMFYIEKWNGIKTSARSIPRFEMIHRPIFYMIELGIWLESGMGSVFDEVWQRPWANIRYMFFLWTQ